MFKQIGRVLISVILSAITQGSQELEVASSRRQKRLAAQECWLRVCDGDGGGGPSVPSSPMEEEAGPAVAILKVSHGKASSLETAWRQGELPGLQLPLWVWPSSTMHGAFPGCLHRQPFVLAAA